LGRNNRGATNAVLWERRARYILDELKTVCHGPNQPSQTGRILLRAKPLKKPSLSLRRFSDLTQPKERAEWKGEIICEEGNEDDEYRVRGRPAILRGFMRLILHTIVCVE
jgi:hypothetical protein